jgi:hypothetical protein
MKDEVGSGKREVGSGKWEVGSEPPRTQRATEGERGG